VRVFYLDPGVNNMELREKSKIMDEEAIEKALTRIAHEIIESTKETDKLVISGIRTRGAYLAERIVKKLQELNDTRAALGVLDITLYRDDLTAVASQPVVHSTEIPFDLTGKKVVLVDDVLYTTRTMRAAIDELMDFGRPCLVQIAVLIDRGHRELPICPDYVGKNIPTSQDEVVEVQINEVDGKDQVVVMEKVRK
jgi:pyrimidine operon attenuation protein/uracil phosphoribosyltransferase